MGNIVSLEERLNEVDYLEEVKKRDGGTYIKVYPFRLAKHLLINEKIHNDTVNFMYYCQAEGIWKSDTERYLKQLITDTLGEHTNINRIRETLEHIKNITYVSNSQDIFDKRQYALTLKNGTYYFKNGKEKAKFIPDWIPYDYSTTKINIDYDEKMIKEGDTLPVNTYKFLSSILDKEEIDLIFEWLGFCLIKGYPLQKLLILHGSGGNGKSTLINFVSDFLGSKNVSNISLDTLQNEKFGRAHLKGKLLNGCADISDTFFKSTDFIKGLTGNDTIYAEFKGEDGFSFTNFAKLIFSANTLPSFRDRSEGLERRLILLPMNKKPVNTGITAKEILKDKAELSRILFHAIESIQKVLETGNFSVTKKMEQALKDWFEKLDNVAMFVNECCELQATARTSIKTLFNDYKWFCDDNNYKAIGKQNFTERLIDRYELERGKSGSLGHFLTGIKLTNDD